MQGRPALKALQEKGTTFQKAEVLNPEHLKAYLDNISMLTREVIDFVMLTFVQLGRALTEGKHDATTIYGMEETGIAIAHMSGRVRQVGTPARSHTGRPPQGRGTSCCFMVQTAATVPAY